MKMYKLRADRNAYFNAYISADEIDMVLGDYFLLDEDNWNEFWKPMNVSFVNDSDSNKSVQIPDITVWGTTSNLVCNEKAYQSLKNHLHFLGERLPLTCEGMEYWLFHATNKIPISKTDVKQSNRTIDESSYAEVTEITLLPGVLDENLVLLTEYNNFKNLYCNDSFKELCEIAELRGLVFKNDYTNAP